MRHPCLWELQQQVKRRYPVTVCFFPPENVSSLFILPVCVLVLWTAQGNVLAINSTDSTSGRNSGIFWALLQFR